MQWTIRTIHVLTLILVLLGCALAIDAYFIRRDVGLMDVLRLEPAGISIIVKDPDNPNWYGKSAHVASILEKLVAVYRERHHQNVAILPIHVHVSGTLVEHGEAYRVLGRSFIVISARRVRSDGADGTLVHEFAHLLTWGAGHGDLWRGACMALLDEYYRGMNIPLERRDAVNCYAGMMPTPLRAELLFLCGKGRGMPSVPVLFSGTLT